MCIIIGDVHQFIGHCLIPLDPCIHILRQQWYKSLFENNKNVSDVSDISDYICHTKLIMSISETKKVSLLFTSYICMSIIFLIKNKVFFSSLMVGLLWIASIVNLGNLFWNIDFKAYKRATDLIRYNMYSNS